MCRVIHCTCVYCNSSFLGHMPVSNENAFGFHFIMYTSLLVGWLGEGILES